MTTLPIFPIGKPINESINESTINRFVIKSENGMEITGYKMMVFASFERVGTFGTDVVEVLYKVKHYPCNGRTLQ